MSSNPPRPPLFRCARGAIAVEFALLFPVLVLMIYMIFETGRGVWQQNVLQLSVEEAGRFAMANTDATVGQITATAQAMAVGVDLDDVTYAVTFEAGASGVDFVVITAQMPYALMMGDLLAGVGIDPITLFARSRVPVPQ